MVGRRFFGVLVGETGKNVIDSLYAIVLFSLGFVFSVIFALAVIRPEEAGQWGDFFGGITNPILTFMTFIAIIITINLQIQELRETREELKRSANALTEQHKILEKQTFESAFFQMLNLHNSIVNSIKIEYNEREGLMSGQTRLIKHQLSGRESFVGFLYKLEEIYNQHEGWKDEIKKLDRSYNNFWRQYQSHLGHYYRYLYNIIKLVDQSNFDKDSYMKLIRAQLSDQELILLFYNCLAGAGENFKIYISRYNMLDNMPPSLLLKADHVALMSE
jgi:hypothetical protein